MPKNSVSVIKTVDGLQSPAAGPIVAIMIGIDVHDGATADSFVAEVAEQFKMQRMISPPNTNALLVTMVGDMSAARFAECWRALVRGDEILTVFMSQMRLADVRHGTAAGQALESVSLLR